MLAVYNLLLEVAIDGMLFHEVEGHFRGLECVFDQIGMYTYPYYVTDLTL